MVARNFGTKFKFFDNLGADIIRPVLLQQKAKG